MKVMVTGAGGFVGRALIRQLSEHDVIAIDHMADTIPALPHVTAIGGDLRDQSVLEKASANHCDAVVHLATVPGGAAEHDPGKAWCINVDATMQLASAVANADNPPRFVFASSIAVFGEPLTTLVDDETPVAPKMLYGGHKAMMEQWLAMLSRRGSIDAVSLRLSGVIARPQVASGMKSAFMSNVFHALANSRKFQMPVSAAATSWLTSRQTAATNVAHALSVDLTNAPSGRAITLPALRVRIDDLANEICRATGTSSKLVEYIPDQSLEAAFGALPKLETPTADSLGFRNDGDIASLVSRALAAIEPNGDDQLNT